MSNNLFSNPESELNKFRLSALVKSDDNNASGHSHQIAADPLNNLGDEEIKNQHEDVDMQIEEPEVLSDEENDNNNHDELSHQLSAAKISSVRAISQNEEDQVVTPKRSALANGDEVYGELELKIKSGDFLTSSNKK